ncbi:MAG: hypothetical protein HY290_24720 [Planctomycetia bacterium]|nr:hypothetical protein [Planctomycetia bacterium]
MTADTPQRRRRIEQLVKNLLPGCTAAFMPGTDGGLAFRIRSKNGRFRTGIIKLLSHHQKVRLNRHWLQRQISVHEGPKSP